MAHASGAAKTRKAETRTSGGQTWLVWVVIAVMICGAAAARFYDLKSDPPAFFAHGSQDLTTDGAYLTLHAKQAVLFGQWDLFGYENWTPFKVSIVSGVSYLLFEVLGVSRSSANATGGVLSLGGILLFLLALWDSRRPRFMLFLALFLCTSYLLLIYGRVPFSEDGLFFLAGLTFLVFNRWFAAVWGKVLVGVLVALCGLLGKSFGFLLGVGPIAYVLFTSGSSRWKDAGLIVAPFAATFALFWGLFYRDQGFFTFLWEHSTGVHGFPHGFESPKGFFECLISYGRNALHTYSSVVSLVFYAAVVTLLIGRWNVRKAERTIWFMLSWVVVWILAMAPFNYLPLRYFFLLVVPFAAIGSLFLEDLRELEIGGFAKLIWWKIALLFFVNWLFVYYVSMPFLVPGRLVEDYFHVVWLVSPVAVLLTAVMILTLRSHRVQLGGRAAGMAIATVVALTLVSEGIPYSHWLREGIYTVEYANGDVAALVSPDAVIAGQYGPAITADTRIRNFPYFITDDTSAVARTLAEYPVTHVAVSEQAWEGGVKSQPAFQRAHEITRFWVRDAVVVLVRVAEAFGNPQASRYPLSDFERADLAVNHKQLDSAEVYLRRFLGAHPNSRSGLANTFYWTLSTGPLMVQKPCVDRLNNFFPTDFSASILGAIYYRWLASTTHNQAFQARSEELLEQAVHLNPDNEASLRHMYETYRPDQPVM